MKFTCSLSSRILSCVFTMAFIVISALANAQPADPGGSPRVITFSAQERLRAENAAGILISRLKLDPATDELRSVFVERPGDGIQVQRFNQYFKGIKVAHGSYAMTSKNGLALSAMGRFFRLQATVSIQPAISESAALEFAKIATGAAKYAWQDSPIHAGRKLIKHPYSAKAELTFVEDIINGNKGVLHLAYAFDIYAIEPLSRETVYVDATTGKILFRNAILKHVASTGASVYSGSVSFQSYLDASVYYLEDLSRGSGIGTYDLNNLTSYANATDVTSNSSFFAKDAAVDAHWGATKVYDYWKTTHNRNSWDGMGDPLISYVHYDNNYSNAFWNGQCMTYGDGASGNTPYTALDIVSHEIGHGICQATANLIYSQESGALNEGFSDIWGAVVENFGDPHETDAKAKNVWEIGEELSSSLRDMSDPKANGQPDTYGGLLWVYAGPGCNQSNDQCGVHTNSGVLNHWFYRMVVGGAGTNDLGNAYAVPAIGMAKAARVAYLTELNLFSSAEYNDCRVASIGAATAIYGSCSREVEAVIRAWHAVGIGPAYTPCTPQISFGERTIKETEQANINGCVAGRTISLPVVVRGPAITGGNAVVTIQPVGGTAVAGIDYAFTSSSLTFTPGGATVQSLPITIYDDGAVESDRYADFAILVSSGGSNASKANVLDTVRVILENDDHAPIAGGDKTHAILPFTVIGNISSPFYSSANTARVQYIYSAAELRASGLKPSVPIKSAAFNVTQKYSSQAFTNYTMRLANTSRLNMGNSFITSGFTTVYSANTTTANGWNTLPFSSSFMWDGVSNIAIEVCFTNNSSGTENDRVQASAGAGGAFATSSSQNGCTLAFIQSNISGARPVLRLTQSAVATVLATTMNDNRKWRIGAGKQVYFYDAINRNLIAAILDATDSLGCVHTTLSAAGNGFVPASAGTNRSVKEYQVTAQIPLTGASFDAIFYLSNSELGSVDPNSIRVVQTTSSNDALLQASNTQVVTPTDVISLNDFTGFRGRFSGVGRFYFTDGMLPLDAHTVVSRNFDLWTGDNPFSSSLTLHWNLHTTERTSIRLYDAIGKLVYSKEHTLEGGTHRLAINGTSLSPGNYFLQVVRPSGIFTRKLLKQ